MMDLECAKYVEPYREACQELERAKARLDSIQARVKAMIAAGIEPDPEEYQAELEAAQEATETARAKADKLRSLYMGGTPWRR